ncbi:hypothetical protein GBA52_008457 [Prunus armeniaca]|nr:hypothetical protein GBA52_008457 [Prunus armeniaca]
MTVGDSWIQSCKCQQAGSISGATTEDENGTWFVDSAKKLNTINNMVNAPNALEFQDVQQLKQEKEGLSPNGTNGTVRDAFHKISVDSPRMKRGIYCVNLWFIIIEVLLEPLLQRILPVPMC